MRVVVYTGKGGVGKTSVAAATALRCAELGYRTLVISTDTAHSLGDSLQSELGPEPSNVIGNLDAQEIDVRYSIDKYWGSFQQFIVGLFTQRGTEDIIAEEIAIIPGLEEGRERRVPHYQMEDDNIWGVTAAVLAMLANLAYDAGLDLERDWKIKP